MEKTSPDDGDVFAWRSRVKLSKKSKEMPVFFRITPEIGQQIGKLAAQDDFTIQGWTRRVIMYNVEKEDAI
jgi:hypothetical protein